MSRFGPKPAWLKVRAPGGETHRAIESALRRLDLHTVCEEARCPNVGECWREGTATVMLLGDICTRGCRFCAVTTGKLQGAVDEREPGHVAEAIAAMGLTYVVLTMVNRDDLGDGGAGHVAATVERLKQLRDDLLVEVLVSDFQGQEAAIRTVLDAQPDVFAHNVEVVRSMTRTMRDARCGYELSLDVLRRAKEVAPARITKSSLMVGVGEEDDEVLAALWDLRAAGVDVVTIGQYLRPSSKHAPVVRWVTPETFADYRQAGLEMGFSYVASGPLVRSSYRAAEVFVRAMLRGDATSADDSGEERVEEALAARLARARRAAERVAQGLPSGPPAAAGRRPAGQPDLVPASQLIRRGAR